MIPKHSSHNLRLLLQGIERTLDKAEHSIERGVSSTINSVVLCLDNLVNDYSLGLGQNRSTRWASSYLSAGPLCFTVERHVVP